MPQTLYNSQIKFKRNNQLLIETINLAKGFYIAKLIDSHKNAYNVSFVKE